MLKLIEKNKKEKEKKINELRSISSSTKLTKKQQKKKNEINIRKRNLETDEITYTKKMFQLLSERLKAKTLKRVNKLLNNPSDKRLTKVACTLKALFDILKSNSCSKTSQTSQGVQDIETLKKNIQTNVQTNGGDVNLALSLINVILEATTDNNSEKFKRLMDDKNKNALLKSINDIKTCSA